MPSLGTYFRGVGRAGLRGLQPPPHQKKEKRERGEEERKKEETGIKRERKLNQSFQEHVTYVVMGL